MEKIHNTNFDFNKIENLDVRALMKANTELNPNTELDSPTWATMLYNLFELNNVNPYRVRINDKSQPDSVYITSGGKSKEGFLVIRIGKRVNYYANYKRNGKSRAYPYLVAKQRRLESNDKRVTTIVTMQ